MTHAEWEFQWRQVYANCLEQKNDVYWAFKRAREIMEKQYGPQPPKNQIATPGPVAVIKLGLQLKGFRMYKNISAWLAGLAAAFGAASAQYALASGDGVVSSGEWAGIALQFITLLLGTVTKFSEKQVAPKE